MVYILFFFIGITFGSFLNVLIDRLSTGRSVVGGRSYCEHCRKTLKPVDLIPLLSYLLLRGRCRFCKTKIPFRIFLVELLSGLAFLFILLQVTASVLLPIPAIFLAIILLCFIGIFFADIIYGIIPDLMVVVCAIASLLFIIFGNLPLVNHLLSAFFSFAFFFLLFALTRGRGMGFGDVKLSFILGLLLGFPNIIVALYLAFLTGAFVSIILVVCRKIRFFGGTIPFGPFLVGSTIIALFFGNQLLQMFLSRFMK